MSSSNDRNVDRAVPPTSPPSVLVIDDEEPIREGVFDIMAMINILVLSAEHGAQGLQVYKEHQADIAVVLLDMCMPVMDGAQTFVALRAINPAVKVIFSSGFSETKLMRELVARGEADFLPKPYDADTLINIICKVIEVS